MTAYVLTDPQGQIKDRDQLDLYDGYLALGYPTKLVTTSDVYKNIITRKDIFGGHVQLCQYVWKQLGIKEPVVLDYPEQLKEYFGRTIHKTTLGDFRKTLRENEEFGKTFFVKPLKNKLFTGFTCITETDLSKIDCSNSTEVYVCGYVKFGAEFRAYVYNKKVVDCHRYCGDNWKVVTPIEDIEKMSSLLDIEPIFYSIDVGIDEKTGKTLLIEINDGYALGNYGLAPVDYANYTASRWRQIVHDPLDLDPSAWSNWALKAGATPVQF